MIWEKKNKQEINSNKDMPVKKSRISRLFKFIFNFINKILIRIGLKSKFSFEKIWYKRTFFAKLRAELYRNVFVFVLFKVLVGFVFIVVAFIGIGFVLFNVWYSDYIMEYMHSEEGLNMGILCCVLAIGLSIIILLGIWRMQENNNMYELLIANKIKYLFNYKLFFTYKY